MSGEVSAALILPGEGDQEIFHPGGFQPCGRLNNVMMALAANHAPRREDDAGVGACAERVTAARDPLRCDTGGIDGLRVEAEREWRHAAARGGVTVADQIGEGFACGDHAIAAHLDAIIEVLEPVLFAVALEPCGDERSPL